MAETLEQRIERLQGELNTFEGRDTLSQDEIDRKNWLSNQLSEAQADLKFHQQREEKIEEKVQEDIPFSISGVDLSDLPPEMIVVVEMIVKADRRKIFSEHALEIEHIEDESASYKAMAELRISNQDKALEVLRQDYETCARELTEQEAETIRLVQERDMFRSQLANAEIKLSEKDNEIARLNDQINDYQKAKVFGERESQNIIEVSTEEADNIKKAIARANETWAEKANRGLARWDLPAITPPAIEEVTPFRETEQATATEPSSNQLPVTQEAETVNQPSEAGPELAVPTPGDQEAVSRQEHEALRHEVTMLAVELKARGILPHNWEAVA